LKPHIKHYISQNVNYKKNSLAIIIAASCTAFAQQLCDQYGYHASNGYYLNNNMWGKDSGSGSQCTVVDAISGNSVSWHVQWQWSGGENNVKAYPYAGRQIQPRLINSIGSIPSAMSWSYSTTNVRANVAYDLFTASDPNHSTSSGDYELMIWLGRLGGVSPIGQRTTTVNVGGRSWELWDGYNGAMRVYSFVASSSVNSFSGDLKDFFRYLVNSQGFPDRNQYLITLQAGTEAFTGGPATFTVQNFSGNVN
jgi:xyloglucan-specific endo-beta-1,4-glucanase